ncbi:MULTISPECIES: SusD/RagB family nutrient-binding outer membrane lipoprotein [Arenibacter]|uniref:SusD/RagB family nutrient-binding outer membrane lipoprotein n=1 Tax=Arenibacter TaxID=178469 RepID=UPI000A383333|nr:MULTISPECIES: SusD/RagB family nutrient-binding outer membrane lipoprotein [Arenibacter]
MKKYIKQLVSITLLLSLVGCESYLDVNEDPNVATDVPPELLLKGMELANVQIQSGHLMRISQFWTGQMRGVDNLYGRINDYIISPEDSNGIWAFMYHGVMTQNDIIQETSNDNLLKGISNILEAHAIGSFTSMFGDVPYSEVGVAENPIFDGQQAVLQAAQSVLNTAISQLNMVPESRRFQDDIFLGGNPKAWIQVAHSLKARYFLMTRQYDQAYQSALLGVQSAENSLRYAAAYSDYGSTDENSSLYNLILRGSRAGDLTSNGSFLQDLLDKDNPNSRNNPKTDESRRRDYLILDNAAINDNRLSAAHATMPLVTYEENLMILAETAYRTVSFEEALGHLNTLRQYLNTGNAFKGDPGLTFQYDAYVAADFDAGGMMNSDNIEAGKALLREIMEEKYVTGFGTLTPFDDFRRIRTTDPDIAMPLPINAGNAYPERFLIAQDEIDGNPNAPSPIPDLFQKTSLNQ